MGRRHMHALTAFATSTAVAAMTLGGAGVAIATPRTDVTPQIYAAAPSREVNIVDKDATEATKSLYSYLDSTRGEEVLFGMQHTTDVGITFTSSGPDSTESDVSGAVGDYPAVFGFDTLILEGGEPPGVAGESLMENVPPFVESIQTAHRLGGIPAISAHMENFATGNNFHDTSGRPVSHILPGGDKNAVFNEYLDAIAAVANTSTDDAGDPIPMIFRPFHENTGNFFWWGAGNATTGEFKEIYRYTVEYLRDTKDVHNLLYSFSPNAFFAGDQDRYLDTYPGDSWVDIFGFDAYEFNNDPDNSDDYIAKVVTDLAMVSRTADEHDKIAAFTEFGRNGERTIAPSGNKSLTFFTDLLNGINADPDARRIAYMLTWANWGDGQIYVPYAAYTDADGVEQPAHEMLGDFQDFYADDFSGFAGDIPADALTRTGLSATPATPTVRVVTPADGVRITEASTTVRIKATAKEPTLAFFTVADDPEEHPLTLGANGYWEATWDIGAGNLSNKSSQLDVVVTYEDGETMTATSEIILGTAPTLPNGVVDDFEGYGDDAALQGAYTFNNTTAIDLSLDAEAASEGNNGARFAYDFGAKDYQGFGRAFTPTQDWSGFEQIEAHLVPDGSDQKLVLQFSAGGATFEAYPSLAGTEPVDLSIPFTDFQDKAGDRPAPTTEQLKSVTQFYVYLNKTEAYAEPGSIGLDDIHATSASTPGGPTVIDVPPAPVWTDPCGQDNNGAFSGYSDTEQYKWKVKDHSAKNGKVAIKVKARKGYTFPDGMRPRWVRKQDNTRCGAMITATVAPQTVDTATGELVPGSLVLDKVGIRSAYVYVGERTGTKAGDLTALDPGPYLIIASTEPGFVFSTVPDGWKPSPSRDADGNVVKVSRVGEEEAADTSS